jgi:hypothetical protein
MDAEFLSADFRGLAQIYSSTAIFHGEFMALSPTLGA